MALNKVNYTNNQTVITAENMNEIQDSIIQLEKDVKNIEDSQATGISASLSKALKTFFTNMQTLVTQLAYVSENNAGTTILQNSKDIVTVLEAEEYEEIPATGITLNKSTLTFTELVTQTLVATVEPENTTDAVVWESSAPDIATVLNGIVTPVSYGTCTITAKAGECSASCEVSVYLGEEVVSYTITRSLLNCATSTSVTSIKEGTEHTETFTAHEGYTLEGATVSITMGETDISAYYADGVLNIPVVTGDINISVRAVSLASSEAENLMTTGELGTFSELGTYTGYTGYYNAEAKTLQLTAISDSTNKNAHLKITPFVEAGKTYTLFIGTENRSSTTSLSTARVDYSKTTAYETNNLQSATNTSIPTDSPQYRQFTVPSDAVEVYIIISTGEHVDTTVTNVAIYEGTYTEMP